MITTNYKSAHEHKTKLTNDQNRFWEKLKKINDDVIQFSAAKDDASAALEVCEKQFIHDLVSFSDLEAAQIACKLSIDRHAAAERLYQLAINESRKLEREILKEQENITAARKRFATAERELLATAISRDDKLRARLLEVHSAQLVSNGGCQPAWPNFLASLFTEPGKEESSEAVAKFKKKHEFY